MHTQHSIYIVPLNTTFCYLIYLIPYFDDKHSGAEQPRPIAANVVKTAVPIPTAITAA